jgi:hypothetical protein
VNPAVSGLRVPKLAALWTPSLQKVERPEEMALGVESLEQRQRSTARERLALLLSQVEAGTRESVNSDPLV